MSDFLDQISDSVSQTAPKVLLALAILLIGWLLARLISKAIFVVLARTSIDRWASKRLGIEGGKYGHRIERVTARAAFYALMVVVFMLALDALDLEIVVDPLQVAFTELAAQLPNLVGGLIILIAGVVVARLVGRVCESILSEVGFDDFFYRTIPLGGSSASDDQVFTEAELSSDWEATVKEVEGEPADDGDDGDDTDADSSDASTRPSPTELTVDVPDAPEEPSRRAPSRVIGQLATVLITLVVVLQVLSIMNLNELARLLEGFMTGFLPNLGIAALIVLAGLWAANWVKRQIDALIEERAAQQLEFLGSVARIAVMVFVMAMALQQVGVAPELIRTAFAILFGAACLALALAFGLGGREVAAEIVRKEYARRQDDG